ncbi:hypothetical protein [Fibrobacter sp.]|uniref:hypothetical protein n=1 Tax=Fibrobacter sp. TaxID=35828 RepID=UPI0025B900CD|nr:hypothetical protein [Fibrobacter sp.]
MAIDEKNNGAYAFITNTSHLESTIEKYIKKTGDTEIWSRIEPRTRNNNYDNALSFEVFDPLWMLTRQWQYGRFQGNDCGTPVQMKIKTSRKKITQLQYKKADGEWASKPYSTERPTEYDVEKQDYDITPYVRVESAMQLTKKLKARGLSNLVPQLKNKYPLEIAFKGDALEELKTKNNKTLKKFIAFYAKRSFDGYKVYCEIKSNSIYKNIAGTESAKDELEKYAQWFGNKFLPNEADNNYWSTEKLGYEVGMKLDNTKNSLTYSTECYDSGTLSWYSFDGSGELPKPLESETKEWTTIPTPATFPGAPAQRLWEFEDRKVQMGNSVPDERFISAATMMQYVSMYGNDWMISPIEVETGTVINVKQIEVIDTFGEPRVIDKSAEDIDNNKINTPPINRWSLFGTTKPDAYKNDDFSINKGLVCPPTVLRCEESAPIEEVQFLRDEMANMVWGVENKINDGCGGTMDGKTLSDAVFEDVDRHNALENSNTSEKAKNDAKYSLLIQNRVPLNWIPFIPEQKSDKCNIFMRRAKMPIFYKNEDPTKDPYLPTRPSTQLLGAKGAGVSDNEYKPFRIDEDQFGGYGFKVTKTAQRTRWFNGESFCWLGNRKTISEYQANSGLLFDELIRKSDGKQIENQNIVEEAP